MKIIITGGSGYIGSMLTNELSNHPDIELIYLIDIKDPKFLLKENKKVKFIKKNLVDDWESDVKESIDAIIHLAFHIRRPFLPWELKKHIYENKVGLEKVLDFASKNKVNKLIIASSIAVYGAKETNNPLKPFKEEDELKEDEYLYGKEKIEMEMMVKDFSQKNPETKIIILRLATVTGPFAQKIYKKGGLLKFLKNLTPIIPLTSKNSLRQYVHEDDAVSSIIFFLFKDFEDEFLIFNVAPDDFLYFEEIAKILNKKTITLGYSLAKILFKIFWYLSWGKIPTSPGSINSYSFPIVVSNEKIKKFGFQFKYSAKDAFLGKKGKYSKLLAPES